MKKKHCLQKEKLSEQTVVVYLPSDQSVLAAMSPIMAKLKDHLKWKFVNTQKFPHPLEKKLTAIGDHYAIGEPFLFCNHSFNFDKFSIQTLNSYDLKV